MDLSQAGALAFYILSTLFFDNFVIIFVVTVLLAALDFWVVKNVSGRILVGLRWWNEINDLGESVWKFECLDQESLARMNKKDSWLFWWTLYLTAVAWIVLGIFSLIKFQADYLLVVGVCLTLSIANIVGFTKCRKDAKKQIQQFASQTIASRFSSTIQSAFSVVHIINERAPCTRRCESSVFFKVPNALEHWLPPVPFPQLNQNTVLVAPECFKNQTLMKDIRTGRLVG
ncbi:hypothetical protein GBA52_000344 [Prunus armeniaca]|nr:hypothetical protein GBA52_000344 [Prunus armeniaca]